MCVPLVQSANANPNAVGSAGGGVAATAPHASSNTRRTSSCLSVLMDALPFCAEISEEKGRRERKRRLGVSVALLIELNMQKLVSDYQFRYT